MSARSFAPKLSRNVESKVPLDFVSPAGRTRLELPLIGPAQRDECGGGACGGERLGSGRGRKACVSNLVSADKRGEVVRFEDGFTVINDTYNSSPSALNALADLLASPPGLSPQGVLAAGEMRELGTSAAELHRECGRHVASLKKIDWIFACKAKRASFRWKLAPEHSKDRTQFFENSTEAGKALAEVIQERRFAALEGLRAALDVETILEAIETKYRRVSSKNPAETLKAGKRGATDMLLPLLLRFASLFSLSIPLRRRPRAVASLTALVFIASTGSLGDRAPSRYAPGEAVPSTRNTKAHQKKAGEHHDGRRVDCCHHCDSHLLLWVNLRNPYVLLALGATLAFRCDRFRR